MKEHGYPLAEQAYKGAAAEKVHAFLLHQASAMETFDVAQVSVCPVCGYVMAGAEVPERCPVCGGPSRQFETFA